MPNDLQDWQYQTGLSLRAPYVLLDTGQTGMTNAGTPYVLATLTYALVFGIGNFWLSVINTAVSTEGWLKLRLANTTRATNTYLLSVLVVPGFPVYVQSFATFDLAGALQNIGSQIGDTIEIQGEVQNVVGVPVVDAALLLYYTNQ